MHTCSRDPGPPSVSHTSLASPLVQGTTATPYPILANSSPPLGLRWHVASPACHCPVCSGRVHAPLRVLSPLRARPSDIYGLHFPCLPIMPLLSWPENQWRSWHVISVRQTHAKKTKECPGAQASDLCPESLLLRHTRPLSFPLSQDVTEELVGELNTDIPCSQAFLPLRSEPPSSQTHLLHLSGGRRRGMRNGGEQA